MAADASCSTRSGFRFHLAQQSYKAQPSAKGANQLHVLVNRAGSTRPANGPLSNIGGGKAVRTNYQYKRQLEYKMQNKPKSPRRVESNKSPPASNHKAAIIRHEGNHAKIRESPVGMSVFTQFDQPIIAINATALL